MKSKESVNYNKALRYAFKMVKRDNKDLVHDAYLKWHKYTGKNLFSEDLRLVTKVVKNMAYSKMINSYCTYMGERRKKYNCQSLDPVLRDNGDWYEHGPLIVEPRIVEELSAEYIKRVFDKKLTPREKKILKFKLQGYDNISLGKKIGVKPVLISYSLTKIRGKFKKMTNEKVY